MVYDTADKIHFSIERNLRWGSSFMNPLTSNFSAVIPIQIPSDQQKYYENIKDAAITTSTSVVYASISILILNFFVMVSLSSIIG
jgi:hypothetical protein